jgi:hypothetical protein
MISHGNPESREHVQFAISPFVQQIFKSSLCRLSDLTIAKAISYVRAKGFLPFSFCKFSTCLIVVFFAPIFWPNAIFV